MLKTTELLDKPTFDKDKGSRLVSNKENNSKLTSKKNNSNSKVNKFNIGNDSIEHTKKARKLFKLEKSKSKKTFKSQNLAKLKKKLS